MLQKLGSQQISDPQGRPTPYYRALDAKTKDELSALLGLANTVSVTPANPTGTTSTTGLMMGLGSSAVLTPGVSSRAIVRVLGGIANTTSGDGAAVQIRYGTGTAPANGDALTGTGAGNVARFTAAAANQVGSFGCAALITGLVVGTAYWFDLGLAAGTGGAAKVQDLVVIIEERP